VLDHAHGLMTKLSVAVVVCAWGWIVWRSRTSGLKIRSSVLAAMCAATVLTATAALWPVMEPAVFHALGVAKKPRPPAG
jgi:nitrate reductase NapE component